VLDLRLDQKIDGASGCLHSCMHCGEAQGDHGLCTACCTARLYNLVWTSFALRTLALNWEAPMGSDLVYSILSPEWNADKTRVDKVRYWTAVARLFHGIDLCRSESMEEDLWRRIWS
jgi:hypothetical protein